MAPRACRRNIAIVRRCRSRSSWRRWARRSTTPCAALAQNPTERSGEGLVGAVEPQRRDRHPARGKRRQISALFRRLQCGCALEADPEIGIAAAVAALGDVEEAKVALALPGDANTLDLLRRAGREIDVDDGILRHAGVEHLAHDLRTKLERRIP